LGKIRALRRTVVFLKPDVVISFVNKLNVLAILACAGLRVPVIVSERTHPASERLGKVWGLLRRLTYPLADALVVQSQATRAWAEGVVLTRRTRVIPNPVANQFEGRRDNPWGGRRPILLDVGRLSPEKGFDLLIEAFHSVAQRHSEWSLVIVGEGPIEAELRALAANLLPKNTVLFAGIVSDPERFYRDAALFVLSSRYEGFPNVLLEAMASGCAVIAANCPGGTSEIVRHGIDGVLVPPDDVAALAQEMERLMTDASERTRLGHGAIEASSRFRPDGIMALWEEIISEVGAGQEAT